MTQISFPLAVAVLAVCVILTAGCRKSGKGGSEVPVLTATQAESQLQRAFKNAADDLNQGVNRLVGALRSADHKQAVQSLMDLRERKDLTPEQAVAVHEAEVTIVNRIASAMQAGDANAKKAFDHYQESKR